ncbi:hypothetical protein D9757_008575 [Collybiopsis confluens]|uniref:Uncharacterized protein n=1 Tax=Collybiopsis confluens TaxID=2823264 RepID=A0A8H5HMR4_9AGAR|nr:hypothetical protein D9757_008575 [Collybiopsis confluens]
MDQCLVHALGCVDVFIDYTYIGYNPFPSAFTHPPSLSQANIGPFIQGNAIGWKTMEAVPINYARPRIIIIMVECVLYGIYMVLFGLATWTLSNKFHVKYVKNFLFPIIIALFSLATLNFAYDLAGEQYAILFTIPVDVKPWMTAGQAIDIITYTVADILGDTVLFYRVYAVWGYKKRVLFPLLVLILVAKAFSFIYTAFIMQIAIDSAVPLKLLPSKISFPDLFFILNAIANMTMTLLIAGRIWWISRSIEAGLPEQRRGWYNRTIAIVTESGLIYPIYLITEAALSGGDQNAFTIGAIAVGLAPTLVAVRVGLGSAYDNGTMISTRLGQSTGGTLRLQVTNSRRVSNFVIGDMPGASSRSSHQVESPVEFVQEEAKKAREVV